MRDNIFIILGWIILLRGAQGLNETELQCQMRSLSLEYAQRAQPWRSQGLWIELHEALAISQFCDDEPIKLEEKIPMETSDTPLCKTETCIYVSSAKADRKSLGTRESPFSSLRDAIDLSREMNDPYNTTIVLEGDTIHLSNAIYLDKFDSGLSIVGDGEVWLSGSVPISIPVEGWTRSDKNPMASSADLSEILATASVNPPKFASLFANDRRLVRARFPNGNPETMQWGYLSPDKYKYSLQAELVEEWQRDTRSRPPSFRFFDLRTPPEGVPKKNSSAQTLYNTYGVGVGGSCADLWSEDSYWCSNSSSGGWAEVDREAAMTGRIQIPIGMTYNVSTSVGERLQTWGDGAVGGVIHAWHSQTWAMHMFEISRHEGNHFDFSVGAGRQGARNWCRCDQCTYVAHWCGQYKDPPENDTRLIGGTWLIENILQELDHVDEFYFDSETNELFVYANTTAETMDLRFAVLDTLIRISDNATDISITGVGFRDTLSTYVTGDYTPPSGGDWSVHRGAAMILEDVENIVISNCRFQRLDGNALLLSRYTRNVVVEKSLFELLGESAIVLWGESKDYDATERLFPLNTTIMGNVMREVGLYQKQSSGVAQNKATVTAMKYNIFYNMPRAAINFNDMLGGGDSVFHNVIFSTCRESGDHGPINSWDRLPFMTNLWDEDPTFVPRRRNIFQNMIIANYGAAEGVDNDDGSSYYAVRRNVFYDSEGFKMDYGGHNSVFEENIVISFPSRRRSNSKCVNFAEFLSSDLAHRVRNNACFVPNDSPSLIFMASCREGQAGNLTNNRYYTNNGRAMVACWDENAGEDINFEDAQRAYGIEAGSVVSEMPRQAMTIVAMARETLSLRPEMVETQ